MKKNELFKSLQGCVLAADKAIKHEIQEKRKLEDKRRQVKDGTQYASDLDNEIAQTQKNIDDIKARSRQDYKASIEKYNAEARTASIPNGADLTGDEKLLSTGIVDEPTLVHLLEKNQGNSTMCQVLTKYGNAHGFRSPEYTKARYHNSELSENDIKALSYNFDLAMKWSTDTNTNIAETAFRDDGNISGMLSD